VESTDRSDPDTVLEKRCRLHQDVAGGGQIVAAAEKSIEVARTRVWPSSSASSRASSADVFTNTVTQTGSRIRAPRRRRPWRKPR
jgi:hypothetical protein